MYWLLHNLQWRLLPNVVEVANGVMVMTQVVIVEARVQTKNNLCILLSVTLTLGFDKILEIKGHDLGVYTIL